MIANANHPHPIICRLCLAISVPLTVFTSIVLSETSQTYVPIDWDPLFRTKNYLQQIAQSGSLLAKPASILMQHPALDTVVNTLSDLVGVDRGVGSPYDAISAVSVPCSPMCHVAP